MIKNIIFRIKLFGLKIIFLLIRIKSIYLSSLCLKFLILYIGKIQKNNSYTRILIYHILDIIFKKFEISFYTKIAKVYKTVII